MEVLGIVAGLVVGASVAAVVLLRRRAGAESELARLRGEADALRTTQAQRDTEFSETKSKLESELQSQRERAQAAELVRTEAETALRKERESHTEKVQALENVHQKLDTDFQLLVSKLLEGTSDKFLERARQVFEEQQKLNRKGIEGLVTPVQESLKDHSEKLHKSMGRLDEQLKNIMESTGTLDETTGELVNVLRYESQTRGQWGEHQLRRILEMSGMQQHIDFDTQVSVRDGDAQVRPDAVIHLPGGRKVVVDAKVSLAAYLKVPQAETEEERRELLAEHTRQIKNHVASLGRKEYWAAFDDALDFVVMFVPGDSLVAAAFEQDPKLIDNALQQNVVVATPTTLLSLAKAIAFGWRQETMSRNAREVLKLGNELYDRFNRLCGLLGTASNQLNRAVQAHNKVVASLESRALPSARRMSELHIGAAEIEEVAPVEALAREPIGTASDTKRLEAKPRKESDDDA